MSVPSNLYGEEAYFLNHLREKLDGIVSSLNSYDAWIDSSLYQVSDTFNNINRDTTYLEGFKLEERDNSVLVK